jgi:alkylated DNA repair dioxygenase AlkB
MTKSFSLPWSVGPGLAPPWAAVAIAGGAGGQGPLEPPGSLAWTHTVPLKALMSSSETSMFSVIGALSASTWNYPLRSPAGPRSRLACGSLCVVGQRATLDGTLMSQMPLFASASETVLVNDSLGRIVYTPGFVASELARAWFAELREAVPWKTQRRRMYDREVDVPRLVAHFRLAPEDRLVPDALRVAAGKVITATGVPFNSVGLNFYRDGRDSVAPHSDHLDEIVPGFPIALLSLGATRRMTIRAKDPPRRTLHVGLTGGSLLVMSYETQVHYTHGIPKTTAPVGARISLVFRITPARDPADQAPFYR